mmetsp:Transcript_89478/g.154866  ORF Transcript_89478/g.154866 Transcript_89478/m.154866 type:complete len:141 (+) Transcript_89478:109-531(+)
MAVCCVDLCEPQAEMIIPPRDGHGDYEFDGRRLPSNREALHGHSSKGRALANQEDFMVVLHRPDKNEKWGIDLDYQDSEVLKVLSVKTGPVSVWNDRNPSYRVEAGDCIVAANGQMQSSAAMVKELMTSSRLEIGIRKRS